MFLPSSKSRNRIEAPLDEFKVFKYIWSLPDYVFHAGRLSIFLILLETSFEFAYYVYEHVFNKNSYVIIVLSRLSLISATFIWTIAIDA